MFELGNVVRFWANLGRSAAAVGPRTWLSQRHAGSIPPLGRCKADVDFMGEIR